ncbi:MAG: hypothetical protein QX199_19705 [Methylococcaceae bacterium]
MTQPGLVSVHREAIIKRVAEGVSISTIAQEIGVDRRTIARNLANDPEYLEAAQTFHDSRLDEAEAMLLDAATHDDVPSRACRANAANAYWRSVSWRAERLDKRYAAKQELSIEHINMSDAISRGRQRARLIEGEASSVEDSDNP